MHIRFSTMILFMAVLACTPKTATEQDTLELLLSSGYEIIAADSLEVSGRQFKVIALKQAHEDSLIYEVDYDLTRPLLIQEKIQDHFKTIARNDSLLMCGSCGGAMGDPFDGIEAADQSFTIRHFGGSRFRWTRNISIEFKNGWQVVSDKGLGFDSLDPEAEEEIYEYTPIDSLGSISFEQFNVYKF